METSDPIDLTEDQRLAKNAVEAIDHFLDDHAAFASFTKKGFDILSKDVQDYLASTAPLDLEVLTEEGFEKIQDTIHWLIAEMLGKLFGTINADLENLE